MADEARGWMLEYRDCHDGILQIWQEEDAPETRYAYTPAGGEQAESPLAAPIVTALWERVRALAEDNTHHVLSGTAAFTIVSGEDALHFELQPSDALRDFDSWLRGALRVGPGAHRQTPQP